MRTAVATSLLVLVFLTSFAGPVRAQSAGLYVSINGIGPMCKKDVPTGVHTATVWVQGPFSFRTLRFSLPAPSNVVVIPSPLPGSVVTGTPQAGLEVALPACQSEGVILNLVLIVNAPLQNYTWNVGPSAGAGDIEIDDCDGFSMTGTGQYSIYCDLQGWYGPYRPDPADGATDVSLDQLLSFVGGANQLLLGTDPNLGELDYACGLWLDPNDPCAFPFDPELAPNTTYYWRAVYACGGCYHGEHGSSEVWSFTTGDASLTTETKTWGAVKALYRE